MVTAGWFLWFLLLSRHSSWASQSLWILVSTQRKATLHSLFSSQKPDWKDFWPSMNPNLSKILTRYPLIGRPTDICIHLGNYMCVAFRRLLALGLCVLVFFHGVCLRAIYLQYACAGWKRASESPEPELQMALSSRVGAENGTEVVWESNKCS